MEQNGRNIFTTTNIAGRQWLVFLIYWCLAFAIYLPTAKAGMVGDMPYLFDTFHNKSFHEFLNPGNGIALYQVATFNFYMLIWLFGTNIWLWHLLYVSIHAVNGLLLFKFFSRLLSDSGIGNAVQLSFVAVCLFIICPHASEVVVWRSSNHHSVATLIIFLVLIFVQQFMSTQKKHYAVFAALLFIYASFSHEFFYLIPWFVLVLIAYYYYALKYDTAVARKAFFSFFVPLLLLFVCHLLLLRIVKHTFISHFGKLGPFSVRNYLDKPLKYFFHVVFLGRYFPFALRNKIYAICSGTIAIVIFYGSLLSLWGYVLVRIRQVSMRLKALALASIYFMIVFLFLSPVYFADSLLVCYDRYVYPSLGFAYLWLVLLVGFIPAKWVRYLIITCYALVNLWFTLKVNIYWKQSAYVINRLLNDVPDPGNKTVLLLNLPNDLNGIPMISAEDDGRFKIMKNNLTPHPLNNTIYDVSAYKMSTIADGAHVMVINDSVLHVTLNQWGTWWLYSMLGATSYQNTDYKVNMIDEGHWYELTLKHPAAQYMLLYQVGSQWKVVDWDKKNTDQY